MARDNFFYKNKNFSPKCSMRNVECCFDNSTEKFLSEGQISSLNVHENIRKTLF